MKKTFVAALLLTATLAFSMPSWAGQNGQDELEALFMDADIIEDGHLDKGEFDIFHFRSFNRIDADRDGVLLIDECTGDCFDQRLWSGMNTGKERAMADMIRKYEFLTTPYRFEAIDIDGSGQLTLEEYVSFGRLRFQHFDKDRDDAISASEFCSGYRSSMPCDLVDDRFEFGEASEAE